jgi:glycosyltransferase involved in cell wall biosynthesis
MRRRWRSTRRSKQAGHAVLDRWRPDSLRVLRARLPARCADAVQIEQCGALFTKDVFPDARLVHYCEWFYNAPPLDVIEGRVEIDRAKWPYADIGFDPEFPTTFDDLARIRSWNALHLLNLANCDVGISPTQWQKAQHPKEFLDKIVVAHEGIDTENLGPDANAVIKTPSGEVLRANDPNKPVITYVARNLEPYRGFHTFMRALPAVQREHKNAHVVIVGGDDVSYGSRPKDAKNWREKMLAEVGHQLDPTRTHFFGKVPYADYKRVLQVSSAHVYLTYPFVLSWSCPEAMASGCLMVAGDTAPVREVIAHGLQGLLVPPVQASALTEGLELALALSGDAAATYRDRAGHVVSNLSRHQGKKLLTTLLMPTRSLQPKPLPACTQAPAESNRFIGELA